MISIAKACPFHPKFKPCIRNRCMAWRVHTSDVSTFLSYTDKQWAWIKNWLYENVPPDDLPQYHVEGDVTVDTQRAVAIINMLHTRAVSVPDFDDDNSGVCMRLDYEHR